MPIRYRRFLVALSFLAVVAAPSALAALSGGAPVLPAAVHTEAPVSRSSADEPRLAQGRAVPSATATATSEQAPNVAANVLDGDLATRWSARGVGQALTLDLGASQEVSGVRLAFFRGDVRRTFFDVLVSQDGAAFAEVASGRASSGATAEPETFAFEAQPARYVRVVGRGNSENDWVSITEAAAIGSASTPASPTLLPVEVMGPDGTTRAVPLDVEDAGGADRLFLRLHRAAYRDASVNPGRGAKASVRLNGGPWVGLTNDVATCAAHEAAYGCLDGTLSAVRLTVPLAALGGVQAGANTAEFRFNGTDGFTSGYRVLALDVQTAGGVSVLAPGQFADDDPDAWVAPRPAPADVAEGGRLWREAALLDSPLPDAPPIAATCASCHARDGRDLEYFAFSNRSIEERAVFHGLSATEAEQIASYVRSLRAEGVERRGRPWNPPYQPGPGLDAQPVEAWAAGAGLDAVLERDADMLPHLFPNGTSPQAVAEVVSTRGTLNTREMPVALQLPDWQAWLPEQAPEDVWGAAVFGEGPYVAYLDAHQALGGGGAARMRTDPAAVYGGELRATLDAVRKRAQDFVKLFGAQPCRDAAIYSAPAWQMLGVGGPSPDLNDGDPSWCEGPMRSMNHWNAVKQWELFQEYGLEDATADVYPSGETRGWTGQWRHVFDLAPHRIGNNSFWFQHQDKRAGAYANTAWYQLQVVLQAGNRDPRNHRPPDWKYHQNHLWHASDETGQPHPLRQLEGFVKMYQNLDMRPPDGATPDPDHPLTADRGPVGDGWWLWHVSPIRFHSPFPRSNYDQKRQMMLTLDDVEPGLHATVMNALLAAFLEKSTTYAPERWQRGDGPGRLDPADYVPTAWDGSGYEFDEAHHANVIYRVVPRLREVGLDDALVNDLADWGASLWPGGDWDAVKVDPADRGDGTGLLGEYFAGTALEGEPVLRRTDPRVQFRWEGGESPGDGLPDDGFSVRWSGEVQSLYDGDVTFHVRTDDGARLWVGGELLVDAWQGQPPTTYSATVPLTRGQRVPVRLEYYESVGAGEIRLAWSTPSTGPSTIPQSQLYPSGAWASGDVGDVGAEGATAWAGAEATVTGAGADVWGTADAFRFAYHVLDGDGEVTARVEAQEPTHAWAKAGVMVRASLAPDSPHAFLALTPGNGLAFQRREATGGASTHASAGAAEPGVWVRLVRTGPTLTAYRSADGDAWTEVGSATVPMAAPVYAGLAVTSHQAGTLSEARFEGVRVEATEALAARPSALVAPDVLALGLPAPNPARTRSALTYTLPEPGPATVEVYDAVGRRVAQLADGPHEAGTHTVDVPVGGLAAGVYVVRLRAGPRVLARRLSVVR